MKIHLITGLKFTSFDKCTSEHLVATNIEPWGVVNAQMYMYIRYTVCAYVFALLSFVFSSSLSSNYCQCSGSHVLPLPAWLVFRFPCFLPSPESMLVDWIAPRCDSCDCACVRVHGAHSDYFYALKFSVPGIDFRSTATRTECLRWTNVQNVVLILKP